MRLWPHRVTFTGVDERTSHQDMAYLLGWEQVELGILYTTTPEGRNRYPSEAWIKDTVYSFPGHCALHVCGRGARDAMLAGKFSDIMPLVSRVQVNGWLSEQDACAFHARVPNLITQHSPSNAHLLGLGLPNHAVLVDSSGGKGILPAKWVRPMPPDDITRSVLAGPGPRFLPKRVGYAGGLGPDTIRDALPKIAAIAQRGDWIDMENRIRTDDWFDVGLAGQVMMAILSTEA